MIPVLIATVAPALLLLAVAHAFRPQGGRGELRWMSRQRVPAAVLIAKLTAERDAQRRPTGWQSPAWTVQPREVPA